MFQKKTSLVLLSTVTLLVSACSFPQQNNNLIPKDAQFVKIDNNGIAQNKAEKPVVYVVDLNKGKKNAKPGASIVVNIAPSQDLFNTKASTNGKNSLAISSVRVNLCTDATQPYTTRLGGFPNGFVLSRTGVASGSQLTTIVFQNVPVGGPYNATFTADSSALPGGSSSATEGFVMPNNNGTVYASGDAGARIAVSTNQVSVTSALALSPANQVLTVTANMEVSGAMVDTNVTTVDTGSPAFGVLGIYNVTTLAGSGTAGFNDATGIAAQFSTPYGLGVDNSGNVYVADSQNHKIRKITPAGVVTTLAGSTSGYTDATGGAAQFNLPYGIAVDSTGNVFVADRSNHRIRKVTPAGVVTTFAGSTPGINNGTGAAAQFQIPEGLAIDGADNLYVADTANHRIRKITPGAVVTTLAGSSSGYNDATGVAAQFNNPIGVAADSAGNVYVGDTLNNKIRKITPAGVVTTLAGSTNGFADGIGAAAQFNLPYGVAVDSAGNNVYVADRNGHRIRKVLTSNGAVSTFAGTGVGSFANGPSNSAMFFVPQGVAVDNSGNVYVSDSFNERIRKISP